MLSKWTPSRVALVDATGAACVQLRQRLAHGGYAPVLFSDADALLASFALGSKFDLVLVVDDEALTWCRLSAVCGVLCVPALLLTQASSWKPRMAREQDFLASPLFDFALLGSEDAELYTRMYTLLRRASERTEPTASIASMGSVQEVVAGDYRFVEGRQIVLHREREIALSPRQFALASELFRNVGHTVERRRLWTSLGDEAFAPPTSRALHVCVASVRKKLALYPENGFTLRAVYKRGYQLRTVPLRALDGLRANPA